MAWAGRDPSDHPVPADESNPYILEDISAGCAPNKEGCCASKPCVLDVLLACFEILLPCLLKRGSFF